MTILIGLKHQNMVTITADTKSTHVKKGSIENQGTFDTVPKVFSISENIIVGIAGLNELGLGIKTMLRSVFSLTHKLSVEEIIKYVESTCIFAHSMYKEVHSEGDAPLLLIVAGIDSKLNKSFLYRLSSQDEFKPYEFGRNDLTVEGNQRNNVIKFLQQPDIHLIYDEPIKAFSAAIRSINDEFVSKDTYSITLYYNKGLGFSATIRSIDERGIMRFLDWDGNEIKGS